jgi:DNA polymerase I-like protein with 3'-5' exonuclease and polymerase domains
MKICVTDAETKDPHLKRYGTGAVFKYHYPEVEFKVLGMAIVDNTGYREYFNFSIESEITNYFNKLMSYDLIIGHNLSYDLGCLKYTYQYKWNVIERKFIFVDTMHLLILKSQQLDEKSGNKRVYGLEGACKYFNLVAKKDSNLLHEYAWSSGLYQRWYRDSRPLTKAGNKAQCHKRPSNSILEDFCKTNMDLFPSDLVGKYCVKDCEATLNLYNFVMKDLSDDKSLHTINELSDIIKICLDMKFRGCRVDLTQCEGLSKLWSDIRDDAESAVHACLGFPDEKNLGLKPGKKYIDSGDKLGQLLEQDGYKIPRTEAGNYSIVKDWLAEQSDEVFKQIGRYRKSLKAEKDYIQKLIKYQEIIPAKYKKEGEGIIYPTHKIMGAKLTGRFSSGGGTGSLELNVLAISGRDEEFGVPVRKLFLPYEGEKIICADFSNQEPRLMVHYAQLLKCNRIEEIVEAWNADPKMKYHKKVADMSGLPYDEAKTTTLGLAYDQREKGLSIKLNKSIEDTRKLIAQYYEMLPFMKQLQDTCSANIERLGYIRTIGGRKLYIDEPYMLYGKLRTQGRKGMSKLIQGSALDLTWASMIAAWKAGLKILLVVHDEIVCSTANPEIDLEILGNSMENCYKLCVPLIADRAIGDNWYQAKP